MWALVTELLFSFILLAFLVISCQNVLHIASGSVRSVLKYMHAQLDRELGEVEGVSDEEENVTTRVVRRRVILKVPQGEGGLRGKETRAEIVETTSMKLLKLMCCCSEGFSLSPVPHKIHANAALIVSAR